MSATTGVYEVWMGTVEPFVQHVMGEAPTAALGEVRYVGRVRPHRFLGWESADGSRGEGRRPRRAPNGDRIP